MPMPTMPPAAGAPAAAPGTVPAADPAPAAQSPAELFDAAVGALAEKLEELRALADEAIMAAEECDDCPAGIEAKIRKIADGVPAWIEDVAAAREAAGAMLEAEVGAIEDVDVDEGYDPAGM